MEKLKIKYARPQQLFEEFSGTDYIRRIASFVGSTFNVKVELQAAPTCVNMTTQVVTLNSKQAYKYGDDFCVGLVLHEVGHLKHTPHGLKFRDGWHHELYNLLEDVRMEGVVKNEYAGAPYFIDTINKPAVALITEAAMKSSDVEQSEGVERVFYTVIQHAIARAYGTETALSDTAMHEASDTLSGYLVQAADTSASACVTLGIAARDLMQQFLAPRSAIPQAQQQRDTDKPLPLEPKEGPKQQHEGARAEYDIVPARDRVTLLERIKAGDDMRENFYEGRGESEPYRYERADSHARMYAGNLKRKIIAKLRANDRSKVVAHQKKGKLNKKVIAKAALHNPRIYQKRLQPKKRRYVASIILDTSGSMWDDSSNMRIDLAMQASAMLVRTLRALHVPTALSVYGTRASERVGHNDRYLVPEISRDTGALSSHYYRAGNTDTYTAIATQLPKLQRAAHGREQLLIIITDGREGRPNACKELIRKAQQRSALHPMIFYVDTSHSILKSATEERHIKSAADLPQAAAELLSNIKFN